MKDIVIEIAFIVLAAVMISLFEPVLLDTDPCADLATRPDWCTVANATPAPTPTFAPMPTIWSYPPPQVTPQPAPEPYPISSQYQEHTKPWRLYGLTAKVWETLGVWQRALLRKER